MRLPHESAVDPFPGRCPFHGDCLEGLAAGPGDRRALELPAGELGPDHPAWALEAEYLAQACANADLHPVPAADRARRRA